jgi:hypothetical protein
LIISCGENRSSGRLSFNVFSISPTVVIASPSISLTISLASFISSRSFFGALSMSSFVGVCSFIT